MRMSVLDCCEWANYLFGTRIFPQLVAIANVVIMRLFETKYAHRESICDFRFAWHHLFCSYATRPIHRFEFLPQKPKDSHELNPMIIVVASCDRVLGPRIFLLADETDPSKHAAALFQPSECLRAKLYWFVTPVAFKRQSFSADFSADGHKSWPGKSPKGH